MSLRGPVTRGANGWLPLTMAFCGAASPPHHTHPNLPFTSHPSWSLCICLHACLLSLLIQCQKMSSQIGLQRIWADGLMRKWQRWSRRRSSECAHTQRNYMTASVRRTAIGVCTFFTRLRLGILSHCQVRLALQAQNVGSFHLNLEFQGGKFSK